MKKSLIASLAAIGFLIVSCDKKVPKNLIVLWDFSSSRTNMGIWYKQTVRESVISKMGYSDRLILLPVDHSSETAGTEIFRLTFTEQVYENEFLGFEEDKYKAKAHQDSIAAAIPRFNQAFEAEKASRNGIPEGTGIMSALRLARKYILPDHRNVLILLSDMMEFSDADSLNFEAHLNTASDVEQFLQRVEPFDLSNMEIVILTGAQPQMKPEKFAAIRSFWEQYITQNNGRLLDYSSESISKVEDILSGR